VTQNSTIIVRLPFLESAIRRYVFTCSTTESSRDSSRYRLDRHVKTPFFEVNEVPTEEIAASGAYRGKLSWVQRYQKIRRDCGVHSKVRGLFDNEIDSAKSPDHGSKNARYGRNPRVSYQPNLLKDCLCNSVPLFAHVYTDRHVGFGRMVCQGKIWSTDRHTIRIFTMINPFRWISFALLCPFPGHVSLQQS